MQHGQKINKQTVHVTHSPTGHMDACTSHPPPSACGKVLGAGELVDMDIKYHIFMRPSLTTSWLKEGEDLSSAFFFC